MKFNEIVKFISENFGEEEKVIRENIRDLMKGNK